ncbi:hypothetical protein LTS15_009483 [Exophiala xenobiotica]|nr:hypothetical protein LTS15_009483 [Exophiala xenobiotica]
MLWEAGSYPLLKKFGLQMILLRDLAKQRWQFMLYAREQADQRMQKEIEYQKDFFFYLLRAKDPETGKGFEVQELWEEAAMLMVAGSDTTSTALAATTHYMVKNPQCLKEATKEVRETFKQMSEIVHGPMLSNCTYLKSCIDEGLRLCPPVPGLLPRQITRDGTTIDGESLPSGTIVGVPCFAIHRDETYYPSPNEFRPSRWTGGSESQRELAKSAYAPFSVGPRGCIGKSLALMESRIAMARILWQYDLKATEQLRESYDIEDHFTAQKTGPNIEFVSRGSV